MASRWSLTWSLGRARLRRSARPPAHANNTASWSAKRPEEEEEQQQQEEEKQQEEQEAAQKCDQKMCYKLRYEKHIILCSAPAHMNSTNAHTLDLILMVWPVCEALQKKSTAYKSMVNYGKVTVASLPLSSIHLQSP